MTQKEKQLLLKDICARLPYKVKISVTEPERTEFTNQFSYENGRTLVGVLYAIFPDEERIIVDELDKPIAQYDVRCGGFNIEKYKIKPYLRPTSSMTEEEHSRYMEFIEWSYNDYTGTTTTCINKELLHEYLDFIYSHHLDDNNFIEKGLALKAPEGMY